MRNEATFTWKMAEDGTETFEALLPQPKEEASTDDRLAANMARDGTITLSLRNEIWGIAPWQHEIVFLPPQQGGKSPSTYRAMEKLFAVFRAWQEKPQDVLSKRRTLGRKWVFRASDGPLGGVLFLEVPADGTGTVKMEMDYTLKGKNKRMSMEFASGRTPRSIRMALVALHAAMRRDQRNDGIT